MNEFLRKLRKSNHFKCSTNEEESSNEHRRGENLTISNTVNPEYQISRIEDQLQNWTIPKVILKLSTKSKPSILLKDHASNSQRKTSQFITIGNL